MKLNSHLGGWLALGVLIGAMATPSLAQQPKRAPAAPAAPLPARPASGKPNIVIIWGDDIGQSNISAYTNGLMGYRTPNIDSIATDGMIFTDYYGEQSCTAGRSAFITGQSVFRTGLSKVGLPGADLGLRKEDPTIAELLKAQGYATGQFGKNHLGDKDEFLPTAHGFDEFYGNLYHLNAEEEPELPDYPKPDDPEFPNFRKNFGPRGVIHSFANPDGTQTIEDTGPLTRKRMETIDDDIADRSAAFIEKQAKAGKPMFVWVNFTHMHFRTHTKPESLGQAGRWLGPYADTMIDHDKNVGTVLAKLKELGLEDNTLVFYSTDNGPHMNSWPDAAMTPFRNEKNSNWEGAYRGAGHGSLAGEDQAAAPCRTRSSRISIGCRPCWRWPACPTSRKSSSPATRPARRPIRFISTVIIFCPTSPAKRRKVRARSFSISPTTAI